MDTGSTERTRRCRVVTRARAEKEIDALCGYLDAHRPGAGESFYERLLHAFGLLAEMPRMGRMAHAQRLLRKGYRCFVVEDHCLYYKVGDRELEVCAVVHAARDLGTTTAAREEDGSSGRPRRPPP